MTKSRQLSSSKIRSCLFAAVLLCVGSVSTQSYAAGKLPSKQRIAKKKKAKSKRIKASTKSTTSLVALTRQEARINVAAARAIEKGAVHTLMPQHRGKKVLNIGVYSKLVRRKLLEALNGTARGGSYEINFSGVPAAERVAIVKELVGARTKNAHAYESAAEYSSVHLTNTTVEYREGTRSLSFQTSPAL